MLALRAPQVGSWAVPCFKFAADARGAAPRSGVCVPDPGENCGDEPTTNKIMYSNRNQKDTRVQ